MSALRIIITTVIACISFIACVGSDTVLGTQPIRNIRAVEVHSDILVRWAKEGVRDAVVVHIDAHDDIRAIAEPKLEKLRELMQKKDWQGFARANTMADHGLYDAGNFLYAGARLGIIREVYWVIPFPLFIPKDAVAWLQNLLRFCSFSENDIATFSLRNGCFSGKYHGIPLTICGIENLPDIKKPVILSIDVDYFPQFARTYSSTLAEGVRSLFSACLAKGYRVRDTVISYSISGGFLKPKHRWVGELIAQILQKPAMVSSSSIPARFAALQEIDIEIQRGAFAEALDRINAGLSNRNDPAFKLYQSEALLGSGQTDAALSSAAAACQQDKAYCYGLPQLGLVLVEQGRDRDAVRFFSLGYEKNRSMDFGQMQYGAALATLGRKEDALAAFNEYRALHGSFPIDFMITAVYIRSGEREQARQMLLRALDGLNNTEYTDDINRPLAEAVSSIVEFCRKNGCSDELHKIESSVLYAKLRQAFPLL